MSWIVYYFRGGMKFQGTEKECRDWIEAQKVPEDYWMEKVYRDEEDGN